MPPDEHPSLLEETVTERAPLRRRSAHGRRPGACSGWSAARPRQWIKNLACFAGLVFAQLLFHEDAVLRALAGVRRVLPGVVERVPAQRRLRPRARPANPSKRKRPVASGLVPVSWALAASAGLLVAALGSSWLLSPLCMALMATYLAMNVAYSLRLKHAVLLDVGVIAFGFVLRVLVRGLRGRARSRRPGSCSACSSSRSSWASPSVGARCTGWRTTRSRSAGRSWRSTASPSSTCSWR